MLHDGSQYASPVGLKTLHLEPVGHVWLSQGLAVKQMKEYNNYAYASVLIIKTIII